MRRAGSPSSVAGFPAFTQHCFREVMLFDLVIAKLIDEFADPGQHIGFAEGVLPKLRPLWSEWENPWWPQGAVRPGEEA